MKKLMISTIIVLPLLLLAILLISGAIMSMLTHIYVDSIEFTSNEAIILVMDNEKNPPKYNLSEDITILPLKASDRNLIYSSNDNALIEISGDGVITAKGYGETYITVTSEENRAASAKRKVIITDESVHELKMNDGYLKDLYEGESQQLFVSILPEEAENKYIKWSCDREDVLQVSENGTVTAIGSGEVVVTATSVANATVKATATIRCHARVRDMSFDKTLLVTSAEKTSFPKIDFYPAGVESDLTISYSSSSNDIATVDEKGVISFKRAGSVTITVEAEDYAHKKIKMSKDFTSTMGYFVGTLFTTKQMSYFEFDEAKPIEFGKLLDESYQEITSVECFVDGVKKENLLDENYIKEKLQIKFVHGLPECENSVEIRIQARVYDFKNDELTTYEDSFFISKTQTEQPAVVKLNGIELQEDAPNEIFFDDIGQSLVLEITDTDDLEIKIDDTAYIGVNISNSEVVLTSKSVCSDTKMFLSVGTTVLELDVTVKAKAKILEVFCGDKKLLLNGNYFTLLDMLTFVAKPSRADGQPVSDSELFYQVDGSDIWQKADGWTITLGSQFFGRVIVKCDDQTFAFSVEKTTDFDFGLKIFVTNTRGNKIEICAADSVEDNNDFVCNLPSNIQDSVTFELTLKNEFLGMLGDKDSFKNLFSVEIDDDSWIVDYSALSKQITVIFSSQLTFDTFVYISAGEKEVTCEILRVDIKQIEFVGYDSENSEQVYLGYQQVRVFAKHSYYDKKVDYFKVPYRALSDLISKSETPKNLITWKLSRYVGETFEEVVAEQRGDYVLFKGSQYFIKQIDGEHVLTDSDENVVSGKDGENKGNITWIDVYSEPGQARIYFGDFGGLSESDVYNNYFGAFDDKPWSEPELADDDKGGGVTIAPSDNAYSFLRIEAGDGAKDGKNCHFNFNILQDDTLVNVFDAKGYYGNDRVVLHSNLYGVGELGESGKEFDKAKNNGLFLEKSSGLGKTVIYGNGYQVNFEAKNRSMDKYSEGDGVTVERAYNANIKCSNPSDVISSKEQKMVLRMNYAYYCELSLYYKFKPANGSFYTKNTVFAYIPKAAIQLEENEPLYAENIITVECGVGIMLDNSKKHDSKIYFKGNIDILDYANKSGLENLNPIVGLIYAEVVKNVKDYLEWQGLGGFTVKANITSGDSNTDKAYVNVAMFVAGDISENVFVWKDSDYVKADGATLSSGAKLVNKELAYGYYAWTYEILDEHGERLDHAKVELSGTNATVSSDSSQMFTQNRYIRLQCEFKNDGVKNNDHILWHMQGAYRDPSIVRSETHIENLRNTLKGQNWADGSGVDRDGNIIDPAAVSISNIFSCVIIPKRENYSVTLSVKAA